MLWGSHLGGLELRSEGGETRLLGRFPYGRETVLREARSGTPELREVFAPRAFRMRVEHRNRNIMALAGHDFAKPLASLATHTLDMEDTEDALLVEIRIKPEIAAASYCRDILAGVRAGLTVGLSPGFRVASDPAAEVIQRQGNVVRREVRTALLEEISIVTRPAYPQAQIEARCWSADGTMPRPTAPHHLKRWRL
ncbi:HK97 family phage prohead protease [Cereibacter johrii]|uniref:HK97 family phage prohead protease n=1 Tax=Cereibacter johrii TaxID=445629 RepID=UPI003CE92619